MYCKHEGLRRQRTEDQAFISLHLQADQIRKIFNTNVVSLTLSWRRPLSYRNQSIDLILTTDTEETRFVYQNLFQT